VIVEEADTTSDEDESEESEEDQTDAQLPQERDDDIQIGESAAGVEDPEFGHIDIAESTNSRLWCTKCAQSLVRSESKALIAPTAYLVPPFIGCYTAETTGITTVDR